MRHLGQLPTEGPIQVGVVVSVNRNPEGGNPINIPVAIRVVQGAAPAALDDQRLFLLPILLGREGVPQIVDDPIGIGLFGSFVHSLNPKFEARNPKQARRFKIQMTKTKTFCILKFDHWNLFRISIFGFRI